MQKEEFINKWLAQLRVADNHILPSMNIKERDIAMLLCQVVQIFLIAAASIARQDVWPV